MLVGAELRRAAAVIITSGLTATGVTVAALASPSVASAAFSCSSSSTYEVRSGDSWYGIAERVDVAPNALLRANDASVSDLLVPGDRLCLPAGSNTSASCTAYAVGRGDSWYSIADRAGVSVGSLAAINDADIGRTIHPGDSLCLPAGATAPSGSASSSSASSSSASASGGSYTVVSGDSWAAIAWRADVSMRSLLDVNGASASDVIVPGQRLRLPAGAKQVTVNDPFAVEIDAAPTQGPCGYGDTWGDARSSTRRHKGTDIFSGAGNYVYAVVSGRLAERTWDAAGANSGNSWTLTGADGTRFFYAHLLDFAPGLEIGSTVRAGQIIGWIGDTGNASSAHLHFEVRPRGGSAVNPYPILRAQGGCNHDTPYTQPGGWVPERLR